MTIRVPLPGGNWADLKDDGDLTGADQDAYFDAYDLLMEAHPQPGPQPDPSNPAVMLEPPPRTMSNADGRALRDSLLGMLITAWSYDLPLPYTAGSRKHLPVTACNALLKAAEPMQDALTGAVKDPDPKPAAEVPAGSNGSSALSPGSALSPLPAPAGEPSGTPAG